MRARKLFSRRSSLSDRRCFLAFASTKIIQSGATNTSLLLHLDFCDARRVQRENSLDAFAIRDAAHRECFVESTPFTSNHDSREYLDSLFVTFYHPRVNADGVTHLERVRVAFLLLFLDGTDDLVHDNSSRRGDAELPTRGGELQPRRIDFRAGPARIRTWDQGIMSPLL